MSAPLSAADVLAALRQFGIEPRSLCVDSRAVRPGDVFLAFPGARVDGRRYAADAVVRGAAAVLWEAEGADPAFVAPGPGFAVRGLRRLSGPLAHLVYGRPSEQLWMAGVTGTNGKTSVSQWIAQCLGALGRKCAVVGTLGNGYPGSLHESPNTTPEAVVLQQALAGFVADGARACAMEVSSIGLDQGRVDGIDFNVAVFTNFTRDHLAEHGTMAAYGEAKRRLFDLPGLHTAVLNLDDPFGADLCRRLAGRGVHRIGYALQPAAPDLADELLVAENLAFGGRGLQFAVRGVRVEAPVIGRFNASNLLAVLGTLLAAGIPPAQAAASLAGIEPPPGRMESLGGDGRPLLVVDYAHTPDALEKALETLRETARVRGGRLLCVFGCGGDRDPGKRPEMGAIAERLADAVWITSDNPRSEDPHAIIAAIAAGRGASVRIEADRAAAIHAAVAGAARNDVVLVAGKGHEPYQEIEGVRRPFSDHEQARQALALWRDEP